MARAVRHLIVTDRPESIGEPFLANPSRPDPGRSSFLPITRRDRRRHPRQNEFSEGVGNVLGTLYGALVIAVVNNGLTLLNISFIWQLVAKGTGIVAAVALDRLRTPQRRDSNRRPPLHYNIRRSSA